MPEENDNKLTLRTYGDRLAEYVNGTPAQINEAEGCWLDHALQLIPKKGKILELGSGSGRNAAVIQKRGYHIECTDAVPGFLDLLKSQGLKARLLNALHDDFGNGYDMLLANGVLVHFTPEESRSVVRKVHAALKKGGIFAFSVKQGEGSEWTSEKLGAPRFFHYWQVEALKRFIAANGFEWVEIFDGHTSLRNASWLYVIARAR